MNYSIMEQIKTRVTPDGVAHYRVTLICDTTDDIPEALDTWDAGSIAMVADGHSYKVLDSEGAWK